MEPPPAPDLDLRSLQWSLVVARLGGFRRAAHALGVEQSAVSRRVRDLEDGLGVSLFQRSPGGAVATHAGRAFLKRVDALMGGLAAAVAEARDAGAGQAGRLRIGVSFSLVSDSLVELIKRFHAAHPRVGIEMIEGRATAHLEAVADRRLDVAVLPGGMTVAGLDMSVLWRERVLIALPAHHPLAEASSIRLDALGPVRLFASEGDLGADGVVRLGSGRSGALEIEVQQAGVPLLLEQSRMGFGLTLLSSGALASLRAYSDLVFRPLATTGEEAALAIAAAWSATNDNPALRRFVSATRRRPSQAR